MPKSKFTASRLSSILRPQMNHNSQDVIQTIIENGVVNHASLQGLAEDDHTHYLNIARHDTTARHGASVVDHGSIGGLGDDDHTQYLPVNGSRDMGGNLTPALPDTYDLGSSVKLWRKAWISELDAVVFAKNTVSLLGGWLLIPKNSGTLAADLAAAATTADFGQAMTTGHFVLFRAAGAVEYLSIGSNVSGTVYNVTRNLDGTGANDWPAGTPYAVLGTTGDGRIELNAYDTPRMSIIRQGATYNAQTELLRLGDLNGSYGISGELYGFAVGDYANSNYLKYDPTNGFGLHAGGGAVTVDGNGIALTVGSTTPQLIKFKSGATVCGYIHQEANKISLIGTQGPAGGGTTGGGVALRGEDGNPSGDFYLELDPAIGVHVHAQYGPDDIRYTGNLQSEKNSTTYTGFIYVPLVSNLVSTSWDGDSRSTTAKTLIDLSAVFGAPAGVKAVYVYVAVRDSASATTETALILGPDNQANKGEWFDCSGNVNDMWRRTHGIVTCDANGDIYYQVVASGSGTLDAYLEIHGYWI